MDDGSTNSGEGQMKVKPRSGYNSTMEADAGFEPHSKGTNYQSKIHRRQ